MPHEDWQATMSGDRLLCWHRTVPDGGWLNVQPLPGGGWAWKHRGPERDQHNYGVLKAEGREEHVDHAMTAADEAAQVASEV